jgi:hypothetical protein
LWVVVSRSIFGHSIIMLFVLFYVHAVVVHYCHNELVAAIPSIWLPSGFSDILHRGGFGNLWQSQARHSSGPTMVVSVDVVYPLGCCCSH